MSPDLFASILEVKNLNLKERQKSQISSTLKRIQEISPNGAKISGHLKRESSVFEGNIRITSKAGVFFAKARSNNVLSLMLRLQSKLIRQLLKWKENRFSKRERRRHAELEKFPVANESTLLEAEYKKEA